MSIFSSLSTAIPFLLQSVPAVKTGLQGRDLGQQKRAAKAMAPLAGQQVELAKAQYDPNSALFQNLYNQERQMGQASLADTIREISGQNRKLLSMGRGPLLDRERGGESVFRNLMMGQQDVDNRARLNTLGRLESGQQGLSRAQSAYGGIYNTYDDISKDAYANDLSRVGAQYSMGDILKGLFNLNKYPQTYQSGNTIYWNQPPRSY